jgi:hypothetical protein
MDKFLDFESLQQLTGYKNPSSIEKCLAEQGVPVLHGKNGPFTTLSALENGLGLDVKTTNKNPDQEISFGP